MPKLNILFISLLFLLASCAETPGQLAEKRVLSILIIENIYTHETLQKAASEGQHAALESLQAKMDQHLAKIMKKKEGITDPVAIAQLKWMILKSTKVYLNKFITADFFKNTYVTFLVKEFSKAELQETLAFAQSPLGNRFFKSALNGDFPKGFTVDELIVIGKFANSPTGKKFVEKSFETSQYFISEIEKVMQTPTEAEKNNRIYKEIQKELCGEDLQKCPTLYPRP